MAARQQTVHRCGTKTSDICVDARTNSYRSRSQLAADVCARHYVRPELWPLRRYVDKEATTPICRPCDVDLETFDHRIDPVGDDVAYLFRVDEREWKVTDRRDDL